MKNLEGLWYARDRRLKGTDYDLRLDEIAVSRHTEYAVIFTEALELFLKQKKVQIGPAYKVTVRGSADWMETVDSTFSQLNPYRLGATNHRELYRMAVGAYLEQERTTP